MNSVSEIRLLTPGPVSLAKPGYPSGVAGTGTPDSTTVASAPSGPQVAGASAPEPVERPAAQRVTPELTRSQSAEQRLNKVRWERDPSLDGMPVPEGEASFGDFLDLINPLHHIPIIGTIYRAITGDEIGGPAKILGGLLFGGPIGFIAAIIDTIVAEATGRDLGETVLAALVDGDQSPDPQVAAARDPEAISAQENTSEDSPPAAIGANGPVSGHSDPFGLERGLAAPIAVTPAPLMPAAPAATPGLQAAAGLGADPGEPLLVPVAPGPDAFPVPVTTGAPVVAVELISAAASSPGTELLAPSVATIDRGFAERMLEALDKYQAQAAERYRNNQTGSHKFDFKL